MKSAHLIDLMCVCVCGVLQSVDEVTVKRVSLLSDMHLRSIRTKLMLMYRNEEATKHLEVTRYLPEPNVNPRVRRGQDIWKSQTTTLH